MKFFSKLKKLDKMENVGIWQAFKSGGTQMPRLALYYFGGERFNLSTEKA